jgi:hypothetical protein
VENFDSWDQSMKSHPAIKAFGLAIKNCGFPQRYRNLNSKKRTRKSRILKQFLYNFSQQ